METDVHEDLSEGGVESFYHEDTDLGNSTLVTCTGLGDAEGCISLLEVRDILSQG